MIHLDFTASCNSFNKEESVTGLPMGTTPTGGLDRGVGTALVIASGVLVGAAAAPAGGAASVAGAGSGAVGAGGATGSALMTGGPMT